MQSTVLTLTISFFISTVAVSATPLLHELSPRSSVVIPGYVYSGCYTEATGQRALTGNAYFDDSMTIEICEAACSSFPWFGVEYGRECYCGVAPNPGSVSAPETDCSFPCPGNPAETCGAGNRLNMYSTAVFKQIAPTYSQLGCYTEASNGRALNSYSTADDVMTVAKCAAACAGHWMFGVEWHRECYCGDALMPGSIPALSTDCKYTCVGNSSELCGGDWRLNVYQFGSITVKTVSSGLSSILSSIIPGSSSTTSAHPTTTAILSSISSTTTSSTTIPTFSIVTSYSSTVSSPTSSTHLSSSSSTITTISSISSSISTSHTSTNSILSSSSSTYTSTFLLTSSSSSTTHSSTISFSTQRPTSVSTHSYSPTSVPSSSASPSYIYSSSSFVYIPTSTSTSSSYAAPYLSSTTSFSTETSSTLTTLSSSSTTSSAGFSCKTPLLDPSFEETNPLNIPWVVKYNFPWVTYNFATPATSTVPTYDGGAQMASVVFAKNYPSPLSWFAQVITLCPNTVYNLSAWSKAVGTQFLTCEIEYLISDVGYTTVLGAVSIKPLYQNGVWAQNTGIYTSGASTTQVAFNVRVICPNNYDPYGRAFYMDTISFVATS